MSKHLWIAAQQKAEQLAGYSSKHSSRHPSLHRGELGLTIGEWVEVLRAANRTRRSAVALAVLALSGWAVAAWRLL
jgi:hypothetical protein